MPLMAVSLGRDGLWGWRNCLSMKHSRDFSHACEMLIREPRLGVLLIGFAAKCTDFNGTQREYAIAPNRV